MRILFAHTSEFGFQPDIYEYCVLLQAAGVDVSYVGISSRSTSTAAHKSGVVVYHFSKQDVASKLVMLQKMTSAVDRVQPHIVHVFHFRGCGLLPFLSPCKRTEWVLDIRTLHVEDKHGQVTKHGFIKNRITWLESQPYGNILALTPSIEMMLRPSLRPIASLPLGASLQRLNPPDKSELRAAVRQALHIEPDAPVLLYAGSISPSRELGKVLEAFSLVARSRPGLRFILIGSSRDDRHLHDLVGLATTLGIRENVVFSGRVPYEEVHRFYCAADIGISYVPLGTPFELQPPTKLIEYLMCDNLVPLCNDAPASLALATDMVNAVVCQSSVDGIAQGLHTALSVRCDEVAFGALRRRASLSVRELDWRAIVTKGLLPFYNRVLSGRSQ